MKRGFSLALIAGVAVTPVNANEWQSPGLRRYAGEDRGTRMGRLQSYAFASAICGAKFETLPSNRLVDYVIGYIRDNTNRSEWDFFVRGIYPYMGQDWYLARQGDNGQKVINIYKGCHNTLKILQPSLLPRMRDSGTYGRPKSF